jgi:hypothetical protein
MKQTLKEAGYTYIKYLKDGEHLLKNSEGGLEVFASNKNHASWGLIFKNTHLEFCRNYK